MYRNLRVRNKTEGRKEPFVYNQTAVDQLRYEIHASYVNYRPGASKKYRNLTVRSKTEGRKEPFVYNRTAVDQLRQKIKRFHGQVSGENNIIGAWTSSVPPDSKLLTRKQDVINDHDSKNQNSRQNSTIQMQRTCAIVGNSGILLNSSCGGQINQHDIVIRSNLPAVEGFEPDVGGRTNISSMNLVMLKEIVNEFNQSSSSRSRVTEFSRIQRLKHLSNTILWFPLELTDEANKLLTLLIRYCEENNIFVQFAYSSNPVRPITRRIWGLSDHLPSAGLILTTTALTFCHEVSLFGFYPFYADELNNPVFYHYFDKTRINFNTSRHKMQEEFQIYQKLHDLKIINLVTDKCVSI